jgi:outer membrane protein
MTRFRQCYSIIGWIICAFITCYTRVVWAESLEEMAMAARKHDASYLAARADYDVKVFQAYQAFSNLLPSLNVGGNLTKNHLLVTYDNERFTKLDRDYDSRDVSAQLIQPVFRMDVWSELARSQKAQEYELYNLHQAESDLLLRLAQAYYDILFARENVGLLEAEKQTLSAQWIAAKGLHQSGAVAGTEPLQVQARLSRVTAALLQAQWELANKRRILKTIVGPDQDDPMPVSDAEIESDLGLLDDWLQRASESYQIRSGHLSVEIAKQEAWKAYSGFWPSIDAVGTYENALAGPSAALPVDTINRSYSAGIRCTWYIFSGFGTIARCMEAQKKIEKAQSELIALENQVLIQITENYSEICSGIEQLKALDQGVAASQRVVSGMEQGYSVGARSLTEVLNARQQLFEAKRSRSEVFYKLLLNQLKLDLAVGKVDF